MYATISGDLDKKAISHYYIWQHFKKKEVGGEKKTRVVMLLPIAQVNPWVMY